MADPEVFLIDRRVQMGNMPKCIGVVTDAVYAWRYKHGRDDKCDRQAQITIDGEPYCTLHGGKVLINRFIKK